MSISANDRLAWSHLSPTQYFLAAALVSAAMLGSAFTFQYVGGLAPCELCVYQRYPYGVVVGLGVLGALSAQRGLTPITWLLAAGCAAAFFVNAGIAGFHVGVEQGWWQGTESCVGNDVDASSIEALREAILNAPAVRCDEVAWSLLGISMAGWNGLVALGLGCASLLTFRQWVRG